MGFIQKAPFLGETYQCNPFLRELLKRVCGEKVFLEIDKDLCQFSHRIEAECLGLSKTSEKIKPIHHTFSPWGERIDQIELSESWLKLQSIGVQEGLIGLGYSRSLGKFSRLHQFLKIMLFHPVSAYTTCPMAMTDGAARVMETMPEFFPKDWFGKLISRDPTKAWTAGQWMTEKTGGSDVSQSETRAVPQGDGNYKLFGVKWFTSAITCDVALTLAKIEGEESLSLFCVKLRDENGKLQGLEILRLKDKLGTHSLPTAELKLVGCSAQRIGEAGDGVKNITPVLNVSRIYTGVCALGAYYRLLQLAIDYGKKRVSFNKKLLDHPLHSQTLVERQAEVEAGMQFMVSLSILLGASEVNVISEESKKLLRLLTPLFKLWMSKVACRGISELLEAFGGAGYVEDTGLPQYLRDQQVLPIWEGTTNILSLDILRVLKKDPTTLDIFLKEVAQHIESAEKNHDLISTLEILRRKKEKIELWLAKYLPQNQLLESQARGLAINMAEIYCGALMASFSYSLKSSSPRQTYLCKLFVSLHDTPLLDPVKSDLCCHTDILSPDGNH